MDTKLLATALSLAIFPAAMANAHTNTVGFQIGSSAAQTCVGGEPGPCYDVEVFYGTWHTGSVAAEGHLAIFRQEGAGETQVIGQTAGGPSVPFSNSHSLLGTLPNGLTGSPNYATTGTYYDALQSVFDLGSNYFYSCDGELRGTLAECSMLANGTYGHQSAVATGLAPGTYRIDYDAATKSGLSATWSPDGPISGAYFTIAEGGGVIISDGEQPVVSLSGPATPVDGPFTVTATFNEDVTDFELSDVTTTNATTRDFVANSATSYSFSVTPDGSGTAISVEVPADSAVDVGDNGNARSNILNVLILDEIPPNVSISGPTDAQTDPFTVTVTFDEDVTGFEAGDLVVSNATASNFTSVSDSVYTFTITPDGSLQGITVDVPANVAEDAQANQNLAAAQFSTPPVDTTPPSLALTGPGTPQTEPFVVTATFSEDVTGFDLADITSTNSSLGDFAQTSASVYTFTVTPDGTGLGLTVDVGAGSAEDIAGNDSTAAPQFALGPSDVTRPSVALSGPTEPQMDPFTVTATFSENVTGFELADVAATGGAVSGFVEVSASGYTFTVTPDGSSDMLSLQVAEGVAQDSANNTNTGATFAVALSPMYRFGQQEEAIREVVREEAMQDLRTSLRTSRRMVDNARDRMIARMGSANCGSDREEDGDPARFDCDIPQRADYTPFDIDGSAGVSASTAFLRGSFFGSSGGNVTRLVFGEFDVTSYEGGTVTGTLTGRMAWEALVGSNTLRGFYIGGDVVRSEISGEYSGSRDAFAASVGAYVVHTPRENLFLDGYASLGFGFNTLDISNATLAVAGDYAASTAQVGGAVTGVYAFDRLELRPELSVSYGYTAIADGDFTATSGGIVSPAILEGGSVSLTEVRLTPEIVMPISTGGAIYDTASFRIAPSLICEHTVAGLATTACGGGAMLGYHAVSSDGLRSFKAELRHEDTNDLARSSLNLRLEHAF